jgi:hypothetical protein
MHLIWLMGGRVRIWGAGYAYGGQGTHMGAGYAYGGQGQGTHQGFLHASGRSVSLHRHAWGSGGEKEQARGGDAEERTRFFSLRFVSLRFVSLRFDSLRFDSLRFVSLRFVSLRFVSLRFVSLRFDALSLSVSLSFSAVLSRHQQHHRSHTVLEKLSGRGHMRGGGGGGASAVQGTAGAPGEGK